MIRSRGRPGRRAQLGVRSSCPFPGAGAFLSAMRVTGTRTRSRGVGGQKIKTERCEKKKERKDSTDIEGSSLAWYQGTLDHHHHRRCATVIYM